ncbi:MAG: hypothetical protein JNL66_08035, partial [Alphaproteobacteria bacterium]|nr:hypothetical protein [Alphaproteobacteria bacterium]
MRSAARHGRMGRLETKRKPHDGDGFAVVAPKFFDEMGAAETVRGPYRDIAKWLRDTPAELIAAKRREADALYRRHGITFGAYGAAAGHETTIPFDLIPRVIANDEWKR